MSKLLALIDISQSGSSVGKLLLIVALISFAVFLWLSFTAKSAEKTRTKQIISYYFESSIVLSFIAGIIGLYILRFANASEANVSSLGNSLASGLVEIVLIVLVGNALLGIFITLFERKH